MDLTGIKKFNWTINRLKAMSMREVVWRLQQKALQQKEYRRLYRLNIPVTEVPLSKPIRNLVIDDNRLSINWENKTYSLFTKLDLFGVYSYEQYKKKWNAGFQTNNSWPQEPCTYSIPTSHRVDIGDIRTNWELNRHFQFSALAKNYYLTGDCQHLDELKNLFNHWNDHNLFLHGVEWTSAMELAIRVNSWVYTYAFLKKAFEKYQKKDQELLCRINQGVLVMTNYIIHHRARFSSANNHLIVEMYAVGLVGIICSYNPWEKLAIKILTEELPRQNYCDGVNKEMSLHYQSFIMEAYGLLLLLMEKNHIDRPVVWSKYLVPMSEFLADSCGSFGETVVFGDNDEGKLLDLLGQPMNHYRYVLDLMSCLLEKRYSNLEQCHENLFWIIPDKVIHTSRKKEHYYPKLICCYKEGGYTFLRSKDKRILIGMDHAELGYGPIAAHGHADALSFQMFMDGIPIFVDPGTYNYHVTPGDRDRFRSSACHNTLTVNGENQAEMLGPFLWGKRPATKLTEIKDEDDKITLSLQTEYSSLWHKRTISFNYIDALEIYDTVKASKEQHELSQSFMLNPEANILRASSPHNIYIEIGSCCILLEKQPSAEFKISDYDYSSSYNKKCIGKRVSVISNSNNIATKIIKLR